MSRNDCRLRTEDWRLKKGHAWVFGDGISTDLIAPGRHFHLRSNLPELAKHVLEDARPEFCKNVKPGDFVVGGQNFGLGSSREHAPLIIKISGVKAVLAKSFARIFFRNAINVGLMAIECDAKSIQEGDILSLDLKNSIVINHSSNTKILFAPLPGIMQNILSEGGLVKYIKNHDSL